MGTRYTTNLVSNYNSSPPSDDGSQTVANQGVWATIKTKIGDPLNSAIAAINTALLTSLDQSARAVTTSGTISASDHDRTIEISSSISTAIVLTLSDASTLAAGFVTSIVNRSSVSHTIARATVGDVIGNTASNVTLLALGQIKVAVNQVANGFNVYNASLAPPAFSASISAATSMTQNTFVKMGFDVEDFDNKGNYDPVLARFTCVEPGAYQINLLATLSAISDTKNWVVAVFKNGTLHKQSDGSINGTGGAAEVAAAMSFLMILGVGDYIEAYGFNNDTAQVLNTTAAKSHFSAYKVY